MQTEGAAVHVLEEDDSSGWIKVIDNGGRKGLIPASYVEFSDEIEAPPPVPLESRPSQGSGTYGMAHFFVLLPRNTIT
jgi:formin-binding protein 1